MDIALRFYRGEYKDIASECVDRAQSQMPREHVPFAIGSLAFLGRRSEAENLFSVRLGELSRADRIQCRFFLGVSACRHNDAKIAREYLGANCRERRSDLTLRERFFVHQGIGFYRYTYGRLKQALHHASVAYEYALADAFLYGKVLASDQKAHSLCGLGRIRQGLHQFELTLELAGFLGQGAIVQAISTAMVLYRAFSGISGREAISQLDEHLGKIRYEDSYTRSSLMLEKARQFMLRGSLDEAKQTLDGACQSVYQVENPRLEALLNLRVAELQHLKAENNQALNLVRNALNRLRGHADLLMELRARGLELKLLRSLDMLDQSQDVEKRIDELTRKSGFHMGVRMNQRLRGVYDSERAAGEDPLGDLIDEVERKKTGALEDIKNSSFLSLAYRAFNLARDRQVLWLMPTQDDVWLFDHGSVYLLPHGWSPGAKKLLVFLAQGEASKEQIVKAVWDQKYNPCRHDASVYGLVSKTRKLLGKWGSWLEVTELGYRLREGVEVRMGFEVREPAARKELPSPKSARAPLTLEGGLNLRQLEALHALSEAGSIDARSLRELFQISEATATRDLNWLERLGKIRKVGQGRATKYVAASLT